MKKVYTRLFFTSILFICGTWSAFSQTQTNSTKEDLDKVFTREEIKPSFKGGEQALDSFLTQQVNTSDMGNNEKATVVFIVSSKGNISGLRDGDGSSFTDQLKSALLKSSGQWNSGLQNNHHINAYCRLTVTFHKNKIEEVIEQGR